MLFDVEKVWLNVRQAETQDLLNRVTVYRLGMEPEAVTIIEEELLGRGVSQADIEAHANQMRDKVITYEDGIAAKCTFCYEPAIDSGVGWHKLWGIVPLFPRFFHYCREHHPDKEKQAKEERKTDQEETRIQELDGIKEPRKNEIR